MEEWNGAREGGRGGERKGGTYREQRRRDGEGVREMDARIRRGNGESGVTLA